MDEIVTAFEGAFRSRRLLFRGMDDSDADKEFVYTQLMSDPVSVGLSMTGLFVPHTKKATFERIENWLKNSLLSIMICLSPGRVDGEDDEKIDRATSTPPTPIGYFTLSKPRGERMAHVRSTMIGIQIAKEYQGQGYGREAIDWALDWAFSYARIHRFEIGTASYNERALALYEKLGFKLEGRKREAIFMNRKWYDLVDLAMLERDWKALRGLD